MRRLTLVALIDSGYLEEARAWREWLLRAIAGNPEQMQIMYGVCGERRLTEFELPWLAGYEGSKPVRVGNLASSQFQLDVYGEVMDSMYRAHCAGIKTSKTDWRMQAALIRALESRWEKPDYGIWEVRGEPQHFTHSKMMAWVAFDRAVKIGEDSGFSSPENLDRRRALRDHVHAQVCKEGFNEKKQAFTQVYGSEQLDASLLMMPMVGFLPPDDPRVVSTVEAIQRELVQDGFVLRYRTESNVDGLPGDEGVFMLCTFWLADCLHLIGRTEEARELFERLLKLRNDVGLLSEEYDPKAKRMLGNFPQAFSHIALVNTARILSGKKRRFNEGAVENSSRAESPADSLGALHEALDQLFVGGDAEELVARIHDRGETETRGAQAPDDSIGRLVFRRGDDAAGVTRERSRARSCRAGCRAR